MQTPEETLRTAAAARAATRLAAGAAAAPPRARRALRLGLPDPAHARRQGARRPERHRRATSPICTPGARSTCPAPAGSASTRRRACSPAKATSRSRARPSRRAPRRSPAASTNARSTFEHAMSVTRIYESPRVTKPYTDEQWARSSRSASASTPSSQRGDVRLTMGGEPTFVSVDDRDGAEWNTDGARPDQARARRRAAAAAARALRPRRLRCTSARASGIPASSCRAGRSAATGAPTASRAGTTRRCSPTSATTTATPARDAERFIARAGRAARRHRRDIVRPATRTSGTTCGASGGCRSTSIRSTRASTTSSSATRLRRVFTQGLDTRRRLRAAARARRGRRPAPRWRTGPWFLRDERMYLMPGDSPMGYRLPLDSLPWVPKDDDRRPIARARSDARSVAPLPRAAAISRQPPPMRRQLVRQRRARPRRAADRGSTRRAAGAPTIERARRARVRVGRADRAHRASASRPRERRALHLHAAAARARGLPRAGRRGRSDRAPSSACRSLLEGYPPPRDPRLERLQVTPDPGVIEVNIQPAAQLGRAGRAHDDALRGGAPVAARHREVHARRPPHRHRRRQPLRARRRDAGRQPVPAPARSAAQPGRVLAQPPVAVVPVLRPVHRPDEPGAARRRGAPRQRLRAGDRASRSSRAARTAPTSPPWLVDRVLPQSAGRRHRQHAPRRVLHRQAVLARQRRPAGSACSSCARSRCRRTRA